MPAYNKAHYEALWAAAKIRPERRQEVLRNAGHIVLNQARYEAVETLTGVPWFVIGIIHGLEASFNFNTIIANGDPLGVPTKHVPAGLIAHTWEEGVKLSFRHNGIDQNKDWSIPCLLYYVERYNGFGYYPRPSPYLWSFTDQYSHGMYIRDRVYSDSAVSKECGAAATLKALFELNILGGTMTETILAAPPPTPIAQSTQGPALSTYPVITDTLHNLLIGIGGAVVAKGWLTADTETMLVGIAGTVLASILSSVHVNGIVAQVLAQFNKAPANAS